MRRRGTNHSLPSPVALTNVEHVARRPPTPHPPPPDPPGNAGRLLEVAEESYRDPPSSDDRDDTHISAADFGRMGLEVVSHITDTARDTHCFVLKDEPRAVRDLVCYVLVLGV